MKREILRYHSAVDDLLELSALNARQARRLMVAIRSFGFNEHCDLKKLQGSSEWRLRVGDWRVGLLLVGALAYVVEVNNRRDAD